MSASGCLSQKGPSSSTLSSSFSWDLHSQIHHDLAVWMTCLLRRNVFSHHWLNGIVAMWGFLCTCVISLVMSHQIRISLCLKLIERKEESFWSLLVVPPFLLSVPSPSHLSLFSCQLSLLQRGAETPPHLSWERRAVSPLAQLKAWNKAVFIRQPFTAQTNISFSLCAVRCLSEMNYRRDTSYRRDGFASLLPLFISAKIPPHLPSCIRWIWRCFGSLQLLWWISIVMFPVIVKLEKLYW